jgi:Bacterial Ig domain
MTLTRRLGSSGLALLVTATISLAFTSSPAQAAAPVTVGDTTSMYAGGGQEVDVLVNDSDPDGIEDLTVCRMGTETYKRVAVEYVGDGKVIAFSLPSARPGSYTFTYYACDFETLVPGTLTVTIVAEPDITAKALPGRPGKIKVTNPADFKIRYLYGSFKEPNPDGIVKIAKHSSVILTVRRTQIDWLAFTRKGEFVKQGHVRGIKLPPGTTAPAAGRVSPRVATLWATGV